VQVQGAGRQGRSIKYTEVNNKVKEENKMNMEKNEKGLRKKLFARTSFPDFCIHFAVIDE
jgi:hypothetical protein